LGDLIDEIETFRSSKIIFEFLNQTLVLNDHKSHDFGIVPIKFQNKHSDAPINQSYFSLSINLTKLKVFWEIFLKEKNMMNAFHIDEKSNGLKNLIRFFMQIE